MPTPADLSRVAKSVKDRIDGRAFESIPRREITDILREVSGEHSTRLKRAMAEDLERKLLEQGVRVFPRLQETSTGDVVRVFHTGTVLASLVDMLLYPSAATDREIAKVTSKVKAVEREPSVDSSLIDRLEDIFDQVSLGRLYTEGEELIRELKEKHADEYGQGNVSY